MGEWALATHRDTAAVPVGQSVFGTDYLRALLERLDQSAQRREHRSRDAGIRRLTKRFEREALRLRWAYLLDHQPLTNAETSELSMLSRIFDTGRQDR